MSPRWKKIWRDLWINKNRTIVVVLAIAVGVMAFGGVFTTKEVLLSDMSSQFKSVNPSSLTIGISSGFEPELIQWILNHKGVAAARASTTAMVRVFTNTGSRNLGLVALEDYENPTVNLITPEKGSWPPARKELVLERSSASTLPYSLGSQIEVETANGRKKNLTFTGTVHDMQAIPANLFPQLTGYVTFDTLRYLGVSDVLTKIEIQTDPTYKTQEDVQVLGNQIKTELENRGVNNVSIGAQKPNKHWGEDPTNAFIAILTIVGSFSLILSVFLVFNTVSAIIVQQKKQVGIMKIVGARRYQIITLFLAMALGYGFLSLIVAIPLGALVAYGSLLAVTKFLNLDILNFRIPLSVFILEIGASLVVPVVAALIPVLAGTKITVREAISDFAVTKKTVGFINKILNRLKFLSRPMMVSLGNTFRQKGRLILTLVTLTIAGALFVSVIGVRSSMVKELDSYMVLNNYDLELFFGQPYSADKVVTDTYKVPGVVAAEAPIYLSGELQKSSADKKETVSLSGVPVGSEFVLPTMMSGRMIKEGDTNKIVIANKFVRDDPRLEVGKTLRLKINDKYYNFEIVGVYLMPGSKEGIVNEKYLQSIVPDSGQASSIRIKTENHTPAYLRDLAKNFEQQMKRRGYNVAYSLTIDTIRSSSQGQFDFLIGFLLFMAALVAVVGGLGLAGTMSLNVLERTREIGVMRSIGASNGTVFRLVVVESLMIGLLSWLIAIPLSVPVGFGFCLVLGNAFFDKPLSFVFSVSGIVMWLAIVTVISILASIVPAKSAVGLTVRDTLSYE